MKFNDRTGEKGVNKWGSKMTIINYNNNANIKIEFENGYEIGTTYREFKKGSVKSPYDKSVYGIGYLGVGNYKTYYYDTIKTEEYRVWCHMLERCYDDKHREKFPTYKGCSACEEWLCFQNFAKWFNENFYEIEEETMHLDKDILCKGNKIYSPNNCVFVPQRINELFTKRNKLRGDYPIGVDFNKRNKLFRARCSTLQGNKHLGYYKTKEEAFKVYKIEKEKEIKNRADNYKDFIPEKLYSAMYKYEVEIRD